MKSYRDANRRMLITNVSWKRRKKHFSVLLFLRNAGMYLYFALSFIWLELIFHIHFFEGMGVKLIHDLLFGVCLSLIPASICSSFPKKAGKIVAIIFSVCIFLVFALQAVYYGVFETFMMPVSLGEDVRQLLGFWKNIPGAISTQWHVILLYAVPMLFLIIVGRKFIGGGRLHIIHLVVAVLSVAVIYLWRSLG